MMAFLDAVFGFVFFCVKFTVGTIVGLAVGAVLVVALLILSGCTTTLPDVKVCAVAGMFQAGADCAMTGSGDTSAMDIDEFVEFLEPAPGRGSAMCVSDSDYARIKSTVEQLCKRLGSGCTKEVKKNVETVVASLDGLQSRTAQRPRRKKK